MLDLDDLKRKAEAAPVGDWVYTPDDDESGWIGTTTSATRMSAGYDGQWTREFCEYAVAAQPKTVLALIAEIERLRAMDVDCPRSCCAEGPLSPRVLIDIR